MTVGRQQFGGEPAYVVEATEIRRIRPASYPLRDRRGFLRRSSHHRHGGSAFGEQSGRLGADTGTGTGNNDGLAAQRLRFSVRHGLLQYLSDL